MKKVYLRFYGPLKDFLTGEHLTCDFFGISSCFVYQYRGRQTTRDIIEAQGVPHTAVDLILLEGEPVDFSYLVNSGDYLSIYPVWRSLKLDDEYSLTPELPVEIKFVLDSHLGKLASYLRMLGFDSLYRNDFLDPELARLSSETSRILLTRDRGLLRRRQVKLAYFIRSDFPADQLEEVLERFELLERIPEIRRCPLCNTTLEKVAKKDILERLEPLTRKYYQDFSRCPDCDKIYWQGSHYRRLEELLQKIEKKIKFIGN